MNIPSLCAELYSRHQRNPDEVRQQIQQLIDTLWRRTPALIAVDGRRPTPEEFVDRLVALLQGN